MVKRLIDQDLDTVAVAICPTYGRPHLICQAVRSFLEQTWRNKKMIILNNLSTQTLWVDKKYDVHNQITVYNLSDRPQSLGFLREMGRLLSKGDYFFLWEDDEISFPWRMEHSINQLKENPEFDVYSPSSVLYFEDGKWQIIEGNLEGFACFKKDWWHSHKFDPNFSVTMDQKFMDGAKILRHDCREKSVGVYRWGGGVFHLSGRGTDDSQNWEDAKNYITEKEGFTGEIVPSFERNWLQEGYDTLKTLGTVDEKVWAKYVK